MKLRVDNVDYVIRPMKDADGDLGVNAATCSELEQEIVIDADHPADRQVELLFHELVHAMWAERCIPKIAPEEVVATSLGKGLAALFRQNPKLHLMIQNAFKGAPIVT